MGAEDTLRRKGRNKCDGHRSLPVNGQLSAPPPKASTGSQSGPQAPRPTFPKLSDDKLVSLCQSFCKGLVAARINLCVLVNTNHPHTPETHQQSRMKAFGG